MNTPTYKSTLSFPRVVNKDSKPFFILFFYFLSFLFTFSFHLTVNNQEQVKKEMYFRSLKPVSFAFISKRSRPLFPTVHTRLARPFHASYRQEAVKSFLLADIGEGITECEVIQW